MSESRTSVRRLEAIERARQALELRKGGASYPQIAVQLGYKSPSGAFDAVEGAIKRTLQEPAEAVLELELRRLDDMLMAIWPAVKRGDDKAVGRALEILNRRAKYLGLDAPKKIDITTTLRELAVEHGLNPDDVVREAERIVKAGA